MSVNPFNFDRKVNPRVPHSFFNMSYDHKFTCNVGELIPCYAQEVVPGDSISYTNAFIVKSLPLVTPTMMDLYAYCHYWFVPYRILQSHETIEHGYDSNLFVDYINGIHEGYSIPLLADDTGNWNVDNCITSEITTGNFAYIQSPTTTSNPNSLGGLLDYLNLATPIQKNANAKAPKSVEAFPVRAYNAIYNSRYRNKNIQTDIDSSNPYGTSDDGICIGISLNNTNILRRNWVSDYFTSMLPWQQKGTPIALPISSAITLNQEVKSGVPSGSLWVQNGTASDGSVYVNASSGTRSGNYKTFDITSTAFDINDLRLTTSVQRFLEANALGGSSYRNFCLSHFGVAVRDENIDLPIYLGGSKTPVIISEVTQTSSSTLTDSTPQGSVTGKAQAMDSKFIFKEKFLEHGIVLGLFSIMPDPTYSCGVNRMWIKDDVYDWYSTEFSHLGEMPVYAEEVNIVTDTSKGLDVIGFQGRWSEMRTRQNVCSSDFIMDTVASSGNYGGLSDWTIQRNGTDMRLNSSFLVCKPEMKMFAFPNSRNFIVDLGNIVKMSRPIPALAEPMLVG